MFSNISTFNAQIQVYKELEYKGRVWLECESPFPPFSSFSCIYCVYCVLVVKLCVCDCMYGEEQCPYCASYWSKIGWDLENMKCVQKVRDRYSEEEFTKINICSFGTIVKLNFYMKVNQYFSMNYINELCQFSPFLHHQSRYIIDFCLHVYSNQ